MVPISLTFLQILLFILRIGAETYVFDDTSGLGRRFDGIGGLSGGGATSKLLVNYPEEQRSQILDYLFKPNFGASLHIFKVEIGGDVQSTDGSEASHMHYSWDENYNRGYEWWLMKEAKKRNPSIKLYGLPWGFPRWISEVPQNPYAHPERTASYIVKWVQGAKTYHNLTIDYIGIWNERPYDVKYIKILRRALDKQGLSNVEIVAADGKWDIAGDVLKDKDLADAVDYIGVHYPGTVSNATAIQTGKQLWASEDYSTYNNATGGGCWARILNQNYVNGHMTGTISWNLIASYYDYLPFYRDGLMTAVEPWSGHYVVETPIWMTAHTTQFTEIGWIYLSHGSGVGHLASGGSYVALVSPDKKDLTIVIETMSHDHSVCIRPPLPAYNVTPSQVTIQLKGSFTQLAQLQVWYTKPAFVEADAPVYFQKKDPINLTNGQATLTVGVDEVWTLTTVTRASKGSYPPSPQSDTFPLPYTDDFESYELYSEPYNLSPQLGSFEVLLDGDNKYLRQMVIDQPLYWCGRTNLENKLNRSLAIIGDHSWGNVSIQVDVRIPLENGTKGILLAGWIKQGGCDAYDTKGAFLYVFPNDGFYILSQDLDRKEVISSGEIYPHLNPVGSWNTFNLTLWSEYAFMFVNGRQFEITRSTLQMTTGFFGIGTDTWGLCDFDNLQIKRSPLP